MTFSFNLKLLFRFLNEPCSGRLNNNKYGLKQHILLMLCILESVAFGYFGMFGVFLRLDSLDTFYSRQLRLKCDTDNVSLIFVSNCTEILAFKQNK